MITFIRAVTELLGAVSVFIGTLHLAGIVDRIWPMQQIALPMILFSGGDDDAVPGPLMFTDLTPATDWLAVWITVALAAALALGTFFLIRKAWQR
jgi:alpha-beta hydrolase superfamily lysophospholipase